jgi:hypothetical protein
LGAVGHVGEGRDAKAGDIGGSRGMTAAWWCWLTNSPPLLPGPFIDQCDKLRRCLFELDPLTLMPGLDITHARRDIMNDPMLEEFIASLVAGRAMRGPSLGRLRPTLVTRKMRSHQRSTTKAPALLRKGNTCRPSMLIPRIQRALVTALALFSTKCPAQWATDPRCHLSRGNHRSRHHGWRSPCHRVSMHLWRLPIPSRTMACSVCCRGRTT